MRHFWLTMLFFTRIDKQYFIPSTIVHKSSGWSEYLSMCLPGNRMVHNAPSGYMDIDVCLKTTKSFSKLAGSSVLNPEFDFFDGHDSHWDADTLDKMQKSFIYACFLKSGNSENDQSDDNGPNACFKECYNEAKSIWNEKFGTTVFTPLCMNMVGVNA